MIQVDLIRVERSIRLIPYTEPDVIGLNWVMS